MSKFQIIVLSIFAVFIVAGVVAFATFRGNSSGTTLPTITMWGTFPKETFDVFVTKINNTSYTQIAIEYTEMLPEEFSSKFISALARGQGPDAVLIPVDMMMPHMDKFAVIPYSILSERTFMDTYVREAGLYLGAEGVIGLPFSIDPLVMYWNRDMFDAGGIPTYPKNWEEFTATTKKLTVKDQNGNVRRSGASLGTFLNIDNAREILGTLFLQSGNPVTSLGQGYVYSAIGAPSQKDVVPAVEFFTQFSNPSSPNYSWNRSMPSSRTSFLAGTLATYFGFASEITSMRAKNPNLNFDVAQIPQTTSGGQKATYGKMYGISLVRTSPIVDSAYQVISNLTSPSAISELSSHLYLPSVRRDVIAKGSTDPYITLFNDATLTANAWLDADPAESRRLFGNMIEYVTSGQLSVYGAVSDLRDEYDVVLESYSQ